MVTIGIQLVIPNTSASAQGEQTSREEQQTSRSTSSRVNHYVQNNLPRSAEGGIIWPQEQRSWMKKGETVVDYLNVRFGEFGEFPQFPQ